MLTPRRTTKKEGSCSPAFKHGDSYALGVDPQEGGLMLSSVQTWREWCDYADHIQGGLKALRSSN